MGRSDFFTAILKDILVAMALIALFVVSTGIYEKQSLTVAEANTVLDCKHEACTGGIE